MALNSSVVFILSSYLIFPSFVLPQKDVFIHQSINEVSNNTFAASYTECVAKWDQEKKACDNTYGMTTIKCESDRSDCYANCYWPWPTNLMCQAMCDSDRDVCTAWAIADRAVCGNIAYDNFKKCSGLKPPPPLPPSEPTSGGA